MTVNVRWLAASVAGVAAIAAVVWFAASAASVNGSQVEAERLAKSPCVLEEGLTGVAVVADTDAAKCQLASVEAAASGDGVWRRLSSIPVGLSVACVMLTKDGVHVALLAKPDGIYGPYACANARSDPGAREETAVEPLLQALLPKTST